MKNKNKRELKPFERRDIVYKLPNEYLDNGWTEKKITMMMMWRAINENRKHTNTNAL